MGRREENSYSSLKSSIINGRIHKNKDEKKRSDRKRRNSNQSDNELKSNELANIDAKVYVGNIPTDSLTDKELLNFFKPFGNISDIRVYKRYLFVQFQKINDAKNLIKEGQKCLKLKGHQLDILPAMDQNINQTKLSLFHQNLENENNHRNEHSFDNQPTKKRRVYENNSKNFPQDFKYSNEIETKENNSNSNHRSSYTILKGSNQFIHCRIILVNRRQIEYAEQIYSRLSFNGIFTSIILLNEQTTLKEAIDDTIKAKCHYAIILMGLHQQNQTISFHFLYQINQEYRNVPLEDGLKMIITNYEEFLTKKNEEKSQKICSNSNFNDKYPLSMLLCLLADGRQLTLYEIDRILCYLLEKKASMLTLPRGTLPPLPLVYSTNQVKRNEMIEQIEEILSMNFKNCFEEHQTNKNENNSLINSSENISKSTLSNSAAAHAAAAIFQAYSQFNINTIYST